MAGEAVVFRIADAGDVERLLAIVEESPGAPRWSASTWRKILGSPQSGAERVVLLAESANECVGFGVLGVAGDGAEIESLAVSASWRRRGIARQLCTELLEWARGRGATHATLEVRVSNAGARALYASLGFREVAVRRGYYREPEEDALVMTREL